MQAIDVVESPIAWMAVLIAFIASLYACREWPLRIAFALVMPVVYGFLWIICYLALGCFSALIDMFLPAETLRQLVGGLATIVTSGTFLVQVRSMSRDPASAVYGYSLGGRGKRAISQGSTLLQLPTRKRWSG